MAHSAGAGMRQMLAAVLVFGVMGCAHDPAPPLSEGYDRYDPLFVERAGDQAWLYGSIKTNSIEVVEDYLGVHPKTKTIVFYDMPGSSDDQTALKIAYLIREKGLRTHMPSTAKIESGAVMVFAAGVQRTAECGAAAGVHSWWDTAGYSAQDVPPEHPGHAHFVEYYDRMGLPDSYYWFAMNAAPPDGMHTLSADELTTYGLVTEPVECEEG